MTFSYSEEEVGLDVINLKVCCGIKRDSLKAQKQPLASAETRNPLEGQEKRRREEVQPAGLTFAEEYVPDQDGQYTFTVCCLVI